MLFVINELSYNTCFKNRRQIYRVLNHNVDVKITSDGTPYILSKHINDEFPQVNHVATTKNMKEFRIKLNEDFIPIKNAISTDSELFKIFDIHVTGQQESILDDPNSIVLSRQQAQMFFPDEDPVGRNLIAMVNKKEEVFVVRGVFGDIPLNSTLQADCFINSKWSLEEVNQRIKDEDAETSWHSDFRWTWLLLDKNAAVASLAEQFRALEKKVFGEEDRNDFSVQNLTDIYLGSQEINSAAPKGNMRNVRIFSAITFLIVIVAAFNYIILSTAVSTGRTKEIGIRKTNGASA